jgi:hypothetical protein
MESKELTVRMGRFLKKITLYYTPSRIYVHFPFDREFMADIKAMDGAYWHGFEGADPVPDGLPVKIWSIKNNQRNDFQLRYIQWMGMTQAQRTAEPALNPYYMYDLPLIREITYDRPLYDFQEEITSHILTRHYCILACEMGTGKSLCFIEGAERAWGMFKGFNPDAFMTTEEAIWYVGPKAGIRSVDLEFEKWDAKFSPSWYTYEEVVKLMRRWPGNQQPPFFVCFDESSKIKTPTAQRSQAAALLADKIRDVWGNFGFAIEMTGTPAPKNPADWWFQTEVVCPGFFREGTQMKFRNRMCLTEEQTGPTGRYRKIITWFNDERKCKSCGELKSKHTIYTGHDYESSVNEVHRLYKRMKGLTIVKMKKDCLNLPEKQYQQIRLKPTPEMVNSAKLIKATQGRAIQALTLLRELSDGFQYQQEETGTETCPNCLGKGVAIVKVPKEGRDVSITFDADDWLDQEVICDYCGGTKTVKRYKRAVAEFATPKTAFFIEDLDASEDTGRYIVWAGFMASIDRLAQIARQQGWYVLRVDGRGFAGFDPEGGPVSDRELLIAFDRKHPRFDELRETFPKVCYVGNPEAGGMALNLTAAPVELFFSNTFKGTDRMQAEDRAHRPGMDENRGLLIKDLIVLPTDKLVLENLKKKKQLQAVSMGDISAALEEL